MTSKGANALPASATLKFGRQAYILLQSSQRMPPITAIWANFTASILRIRSAVTFSYILSVLVFEVVKTLLEAINERHQRPIDPFAGRIKR